MKKSIIITVLALTSFAFAQTEAPATAGAAPAAEHAADTIKKTDEKPGMGSEMHKGHHAGKKAKKHKKAHHGKKHKKADK